VTAVRRRPSLGPRGAGTVCYHRRVPVLAAAISLSLVGSIGGMLVASGILFVGDETRTRLVATLISFAVGTMLTASLL